MTTASHQTIKELGVSLEQLYDNKFQLLVHLSDKPYTFHVVLKDLRGKIDCKLSSFGANLWTRTKAGLEYRKYKRIQDLQSAIKKEISTKVDTQGDVSFSLTSDISYL